MKLRVLGEAEAPEISTVCDVCVVGAGVAGLVAATRLARSNLSVVLLETGTKTPGQTTQLLNVIDGPAVGDGGPRHRGVGGNSLLWAGKLLPLSSHDVQPRPYLDLEGWPLKREEIERYREDVETMMGVDREAYEEEASSLFDSRGFLPRNDDSLVLRWPKIPSVSNHDLAHVLRRDMQSLSNLTIWTDATSAGFESDTSTGRVTLLKAVSSTGKSLSVRAAEYLITAGTLESTRLVLLLDRHTNGVISGGDGALGRYYNDHLGVKVAALRPLDRILASKALSDRYIGSSSRHLHFELTPEIQRQCQVSSAYFDIGVEVPEQYAFQSVKRLLNGLRRHKVAFDYSDLRAIVGNIPSLVYAAEWRYLRRQKYWPKSADMQVKCWIEQIPRWTNRLSLSEKRDPLGIPMLKVEWKISELEERTLSVLCNVMNDYWARRLAHICTLSWRQEFLDPVMPKTQLAVGHAHPAGSTRMGTDPKTSVVDPNLKLHRAANVSVASASVFPTSGSANPTYTIMQLAMRAADVIGKRLSRSQPLLRTRS